MVPMIFYVLKYTVSIEECNSTRFGTILAYFEPNFEITKNAQKLRFSLRSPDTGFPEILKLLKVHFMHEFKCTNFIKECNSTKFGTISTYLNQILKFRKIDEN